MPGAVHTSVQTCTTCFARLHAVPTAGRGPQHTHGGPAPTGHSGLGPRRAPRSEVDYGPRRQQRLHLPYAHRPNAWGPGHRRSPSPRWKLQAAQRAAPLRCGVMHRRSNICSRADPQALSARLALVHVPGKSTTEGARFDVNFTHGVTWPQPTTSTVAKQR